jgi:cation diffusion facilitator CzcD-associated flavoprotein CzcO
VRYTEHGVISRDPTEAKPIERNFDVIIYGTGFNVASFLEHEKIVGLGGVDLQTKWKAHPEALYGMATSQFPNMFYCFGPNSAHVWSSQQDNWEQQARLATKFVSKIVQRQRAGFKLAVHPNRKFEQEYNLAVQRGQSGVFVWAEANCVSYYKNDDGWNTYTMPWTWWQFRKMLGKIRWEEWDISEKSLAKVEIPID